MNRSRIISSLTVAALLALTAVLLAACGPPAAAPAARSAEPGGPPAGARLLFTWEGLVDGPIGRAHV